MVRLVRSLGLAWEAGSMVQQKEPRPRSQELRVVLTAFPPACASYSPVDPSLWRPCLLCWAQMPEEPQVLSYWSALSFVAWDAIYIQRTVGSRTHRFYYVGILLRELLARGRASYHVSLRALQNFHSKGLMVHTHPGACGNRQRVTFWKQHFPWPWKSLFFLYHEVENDAKPLKINTTEWARLL